VYLCDRENARCYFQDYNSNGGAKIQNLHHMTKIFNNYFSTIDNAKPINHAIISRLQDFAILGNFSELQENSPSVPAEREPNA